MRMLNLIVLYKVDPTAMANLCIIYKSIKKVIEFLKYKGKTEIHQHFKRKSE